MESKSKKFQFLRDDLIAADDVARLVESHASCEGVNPHCWPGLTFYRFSDKIPLHWDAVNSLSYCLVVQGAKRVLIGGEEHTYDPMNYLVLERRSRFEVEILEASRVRPFLSFVLQIDPAIVTDVISTIHRPMALYQDPDTVIQSNAHVAPLDSHIVGATYRFLSSIDSDADRAVLAPMYLREIVYRLLQSECRHRLIAGSSANASRNPISGSIEYMKEHLGGSITVADVAEAVHMSESAFAHLFKQATGISPYQFLKQMRLERARDLLLDEEYSVSEAAFDVGYTSLSHFISEFKRYFGETPRSYIMRLRDVETFNLRAN
ncbi:MAG: AraC family transcriptional regulator [Actinobacteria bacterium]|nr:AraC family transcriptional regulator [Actinomycetota bacterium]